MKISIVVPCYNEEECIEQYYSAMEEVRKKLPSDLEYVFVDDGSSDATLDILRGLERSDKSVMYVSL